MPDLYQIGRAGLTGLAARLRSLSLSRVDFVSWRQRLEAQRGGEVVWAPSTSAPARRAAIATLMKGYASSEGAERVIGAALLRRASDPDDRAALAALLDDERRHAGILLEAAARLEGADPAAARAADPPASKRIERLAAVMRPLSFLDTLVVFHLFEVAAVAVYRLVRATNRRDPLVRGALGVVLRDEVAHTGFHEARILEAREGAGRLAVLRMRAAHAIAAALVVKNDASVAPREVYPEATGLSFADFNLRVRRAYERAYGGRLAWLRG